MGKIKVTQVKSNIKRPQNQKRTLEALGLKRIGQVVEHEATPSILGMVKKVEHLVLLNGRVSMIRTVSPILQSSFSSCATYFFVFNTNLPYIGCFTRFTSETTIDFCILLLVTTPILSFLKFLFSIS